jgi:protein ImuA
MQPDQMELRALTLPSPPIGGSGLRRVGEAEPSFTRSWVRGEPSPSFTGQSTPGPYRHDLLSVEALRARIAALEGPSQAQASRRVATLGLEAIDRALPWGGVPMGALHEIAAGTESDGAAAGFAALLLGRLAAAGGPRTLLWCAAGDGLYGHGLAAFGLDSRRLLLVRGRRDSELLWAMEEALRSGAVAAVLGEIHEADLTARRRLQLAAEAGGAAALLLAPAETASRPVLSGPSPALTGWRIAAAPSALPPHGIGVGAPRWSVELTRCRGAVPRRWLVEWNDETHRLLMAAQLRDRPASAPALEGDARNRLAG